MDNLTHSLFGYTLARAVPVASGDADRVRRALIWTGVVASNLPDLDILIQPFARDGRLTYLVHHRGYTHTWAAALPLGVLTGLACARLARVAEPRLRRSIAGFGAAACALHIAFDALNDYGVHPFWPVSNRWFYGDSVFIVEPLLLAVMLPLLAAGGLSRTGRAIGVVFALLLTWLVWTRPELPRAVAIAVSSVLGAGCALQARGRVRGTSALAAIAVVLACFAAGSITARAQVRNALARAAPEQHLLDLTSTPPPGNPLCWHVLALTLDAAGTYRVHVASASLLPSRFSPAACAPAPEHTTAPLLRSPLADVRGVHFAGLFQAPAAELRALHERACDAAALLTYARVPYWTMLGSDQVLGDLRYDRNPALDFADIVVRGRCRDALAPWTPPRADLLRR